MPDQALNIYLISDNQRHIDTIHGWLSAVTLANGKRLDACATIIVQANLPALTEQDMHEHILFIEHSLFAQQKQHTLLSTQQGVRVCLFSASFNRRTALQVIDAHFDQYMWLEDTDRCKKVLHALLVSGNGHYVNYHRLFALLFKTFEVTENLRIWLDLLLDVADGSLGFIILHNLAGDINEDSSVIAGKHVDTTLVSEYMDDVSLLTKQHMHVLTEQEAAALSHKLELPGHMCYVAIELFHSDLFTCSAMVGKKTPVDHVDTVRVADLVSLIQVFFQNFEKYEKVRRLTYVDDLTTVYNRRYLEKYIKNLLQVTPGRKGLFSIIFLDIDNLKDINDKYGHLTGSKVIRKVSEILKLSVRGEDKVFRFGGDEFAILLPDTATNGAYNVAERIRTTICRLKMKFSDIPETLCVTASMGISTFPLHGSTSTELLRNADKAMFLAKENGKNRIEKYT